MAGLVGLNAVTPQLAALRQALAGPAGPQMNAAPQGGQMPALPQLGQAFGPLNGLALNQQAQAQAAGAPQAPMMQMPDQSTPDAGAIMQALRNSAMAHQQASAQQQASAGLTPNSFTPPAAAAPTQPTQPSWTDLVRNFAQLMASGGRAPSLFGGAPTPTLTGAPQTTQALPVQPMQPMQGVLTQPAMPRLTGGVL